MIKLFWAHQDEAVVRQIKESDPSKVIALSYVAAWDADLIVVADDESDYNAWVSKHIDSPYAGWVTRDVSGILEQ